MRERINTKTGMTDAQGTEVAAWLQSVFDKLPKTELPSNWAKWDSSAHRFHPYHSLKLDANREVRVYTQAQASGLHHLLTGATLGNLPAPTHHKAASRYTPAYSPDADADAIMRVYGHPLYCVAAIERQLDWYWQHSEEERKHLRPLGQIYAIADRLRMRADGFITKTSCAYKGRSRDVTERYDLDAAMLRLCPDHARPELVTV